METPKCSIFRAYFLFTISDHLFSSNRAPSPPKGFFEKVSKFRQLHRPQNNTTQLELDFRPSKSIFCGIKQSDQIPQSFFYSNLDEIQPKAYFNKRWQQWHKFHSWIFGSFTSQIFKWATKENPPTFHYTGCLIGILIMVYYNPHITGKYHHLCTLNNQGPFFHCSKDNSNSDYFWDAGCEVSFPRSHPGWSDIPHTRRAPRIVINGVTCKPPKKWPKINGQLGWNKPYLQLVGAHLEQSWSLTDILTKPLKKLVNPIVFHRFVCW